MLEKVITEILEKTPVEEISELKKVLYIVLSKYEITEKKCEIEVIEDSWKNELMLFLARKKVEGRSDKTLELYKFFLTRLLRYINKPVKDITEGDLVMYLSMYKNKRNVSNTYLDDMRLTFSSFFGWLNSKGFIQKNPVSGIDRIKTEKRIKKPFTEIELEKLRSKCKIQRDRALIEVLYSTGIRVSELVGLNKNDIDFDTMEMTVIGKGNKERTVYLTMVAGMHLKEYLKTRNDKNEALFVGLKYPYNRLKKCGIEEILRKLGKMCNIEKVHPHRFRRTMATNALNKGMSIEEVKEILGHTKIDTTMIYCQVSKENVRHSHRKYMSV